MFKKDDVPGGEERLRFLGKKAQELEERFAEGEDKIGIWAEETKDMILGFVEGRRCNPARFFDPITSLLHELLKRGMVEEAKLFAGVVYDISKALGADPVDTFREWGFEVTGEKEDQQQKEEDKS